MGVTMALTTVILSLSILGPSLACWSREKSSDEPVPACCLNVSSPSAKMSSPSGNMSSPSGKMHSPSDKMSSHSDKMSSPSGNNSSAREDMGRPKTRFVKQWIGQKKVKEEQRKMARQARPGFIEMANTTFLGDNNNTRQDEAIQDLMITA